MEKRNLKISGSGSYAGGKFDEVSISGSGQINGDLECVKFSSSGSSKVDGHIIGEVFKCSGSTKVTGNVHVKDVHVSGVCKIKGNMQAHTLSSAGVTKIEGNIKCEKLSISGVLTSEKNIEAEEINIKGSIKNTGIINGESISIECRDGNGSCSFNEMGASQITINKDNQNTSFGLHKLLGLFKGSKSKINGNLVEGDDIYIENANIKMIRGESIVVRPGCEIDQIEYRKSIEVSDQSQVKQVVKI